MILAPFSFAYEKKPTKPLGSDPKKGPRSYSTHESTPTISNNYTITVVTGDVEGAGINANVFITLLGENGNSPETKLQSPSIDIFEPSAWDNFTIDGNYGWIRSIRLRHDNSGKKPGWYVTLVRVVNNATGSENIFLFDRWLATDEHNKKIDLTVSRSNTKTVLLTPQYNTKYKWTKELDVASAWVRASKTNGWFNFYADAFVGGSTAKAGHCGTFHANGINPFAMRAKLTYIGGPINFGIASFSEIQSIVNFNSSINKSDIKSAFTGSTIKDKIKKVIALTDDSPDYSAPFDEFVKKMDEAKSYNKLGNSLEKLKKSKEAKELIRYKTAKTKAGSNNACALLRTNTGAVLTGPSVIITGGIV